MKEKLNKKESEKLTLAIVKQMLTLATSGFGLVAALAWNEAIKTAINDYVKPLTGVASGLASLVLYAIVVTTLTVAITLQLTKLQRKLESKTEENSD